MGRAGPPSSPPLFTCPHRQSQSGPFCAPPPPAEGCGSPTCCCSQLAAPGCLCRPAWAPVPPHLVQGLQACWWPGEKCPGGQGAQSAGTGWAASASEPCTPSFPSPPCPGTQGLPAPSLYMSRGWVPGLQRQMVLRVGEHCCCISLPLPGGPQCWVCHMCPGGPVPVLNALTSHPELFTTHRPPSPSCPRASAHRALTVETLRAGLAGLVVEGVVVEACWAGSAQRVPLVVTAPLHAKTWDASSSQPRHPWARPAMPTCPSAHLAGTPGSTG